MLDPWPEIHPNRATAGNREAGSECKASHYPNAPSHPNRPGRSISVSLPPFQMLVDAHWHDVARLAAALAPPGEAQDVSQQAWTQAYAAYPRLRAADNLRSWLLTITHRAAMDAHRARARRPSPVGTLSEPAAATPLDHTDHTDHTAHTAHGTHPHLATGPDPALSAGSALSAASALSAGSALSAHADPALWAAVAALPIRQRTALALRYICDLDHATVADHLDTTPAASRRLVSDALAALRVRLADPSALAAEDHS